MGKGRGDRGALAVLPSAADEYAAIGKVVSGVFLVKSSALERTVYSWTLPGASGSAIIRTRVSSNPAPASAMVAATLAFLG